MNHCVTQPMPPKPLGDTGLELHVVPALSDNLIWLIVEPERREAAAVDGPRFDELKVYLARHGLRLTALLNTHTHWDHIGLNRDLEAAQLLSDIAVYGAASTKDAIPGLRHALQDGDRFTLWGHAFEALETPGHIDGHLCFVGAGCLFSGDTLFSGGCGYLFDGPPEAMFNSLMRLKALPEATWVCPGHEYTQDNLRFARSVEPDNEALKQRQARVDALQAEGKLAALSTIEEERKTNLFLNAPGPGTPLEAFIALRELKNTGAYKRA